MYLRGECREIFLGFEYQHGVFIEALWMTGEDYVAFAISEVGGHQVCGAAKTHQDGTSDPDQLAAIAIARCNAFGASYKVNCKLFALGNKIVWGKEEDVEFQ
jgi:hypothetical protein